MKTWSGAIALIAFASGIAIADGSSMTFKGLEIGRATPSDVKEKFPGATDMGKTLMCARARGADAGGELYRLGHTSAGDFCFYQLDGVVERVTAIFTAESYPAIAAAVRSKYGEPTTAATNEVQTRAGAKLSSEKLTWKRDGGQIVITERAGRVDRTELRMETGKILAHDADEAKRSIDEGAKGL